MKALLDTHAFIWWDSDPERLSPRARAACQDRTNLLLFSVASAWEIQIKLQLGKLQLRLPLPEVISDQQRTNKVQAMIRSLLDTASMCFGRVSLSPFAYFARRERRGETGGLSAASGSAAVRGSRSLGRFHVPCDRDHIVPWR